MPEQHEGGCADVLVCRADIDNLIRWQKSQNGHMGTMASDIGKLRTDMTERQDKLMLLMIGSPGTGVLSLLAVVITFVLNGLKP